MRKITKRLPAKQDLHQPIEQAGFLKTYGINGDIYAIKILIEKFIEYNIPIVIVSVGYEKAFNKVDHHSMLRSHTDCEIEHVYINIVKKVYAKANSTTKLHEDTPN